MFKQTFLQELEKNGLCYDLKFALRLCSEHGHKRECVHIYSLMGLYEEAVDLALQVFFFNLSSFRVFSCRILI